MGGDCLHERLFPLEKFFTVCHMLKKNSSLATPPQYASEVLALGSGNVSGAKGSLFRPSFGLAHTAAYLWRNREKLFGVLNGIDLDVWYTKHTEPYTSFALL